MANNRQRGKRGERDARDAVIQHWGFQNCIRAAQSSGKDCADLGKTGLLHVEVKLRKAISVSSFIEQAERDSEPPKVPVVLMRQDRDDWLVMFRIKDTKAFFDAIKENLK